MRIVLLAQAKEDLAGIEEPLADRILKRIAILADYPDLGAALGSPLQQYRATTVPPFRIVYKRCSPDVLEIAFVRHCRRGRIRP